MKPDTLTSSFLALREKLHRSAIGFLKNDEDAKDAIQDTYINIWKNGGIETDTEVKNKLFKVLKNICIDRLRKKIPESNYKNNLEQEIMVQEYYEDVSQYEKLLTHDLSILQTQIYNLIIKEGLEYDETAERLNMTVEAVRMNMSRIRKKIRGNITKFEL